MPYKFEFFINEPGQPQVMGFSCKLQCVRCSANTAQGTQCKRNVCIGTPYCWTHLRKERHVVVDESTIAGAGNGLFAYDPADPQGNAIVFRPGDEILQYDGESVTRQQLDERYGEYTAPYGIIQKHAGVYYLEDGACRRGGGTLVNHKPVSRANAKLTFSTSTRRFRVVAKNNIRNGAEIFVPYGVDYQFNEPTSQRTVRTRK